MGEGARERGRERVKKTRVFSGGEGKRKKGGLSFSFSLSLFLSFSLSLSTHRQQEDVDGRGQDRPDFREKGVQGCVSIDLFQVGGGEKERKKEEEVEKRKKKKRGRAFSQPLKPLSRALSLSLSLSPLTRVLRLLDDRGENPHRRVELVACLEAGGVDHQAHARREDAGSGGDALVLLVVGAVFGPRRRRRRARRLGSAGRRRTTQRERRQGGGGAQAMNARGHLSVFLARLFFVPVLQTGPASMRESCRRRFGRARKRVKRKGPVSERGFFFFFAIECPCRRRRRP